MTELDNLSFFPSGASPGMIKDNLHPSPLELDIYLPWACNQLQCKYAVSFCRTIQAEYVSSTKKSAKQVKAKKSASTSEDAEMKMNNKMVQSAVEDEEATVRIFSVYDNADRPVQLKFLRNEHIPRMVLQVLGLILQFHKNLTTITINAGIDMYSIYEIAKFLPNSFVTDLILDNTFIKEGNYSVLLEECNLLKRLSLSRCRINDNVVKTIVDKLVHPLPASKTLMILDLSTNKITDEGAKYIALALRSNRRLCYLNLSDNGITDTGGELILTSLMDFQLTSEELVSSKHRLFVYYKQRNERVTTILKQLRKSIDLTKLRRKSVKEKPVGKKQKSMEKVNDTKEMKSFFEIDQALHERACSKAEEQLGQFTDPFSKDNLITRNGVVYCLGNNTLCYLNLSYNNLTYISIRKLLEVVQTQRDYNRTPIGLISVSIDGNFLPVISLEVLKIDTILSKGAQTDLKNAAKKRTAAKSGPSKSGQ